MANHSTVKDSGGFFQIIPASRQVKVPADQKAIGAVGDHLSEQLTFECPQFIDGHDVANCARKYVTWKNVDGELGHDELVVDKTEDEMLYLVWTIRNALTGSKGLVHFSIHFEDVAEDGETIVYRWSTLTNQNCEILDAVNAQLGTYAAIYVRGKTLVISDYTPVHDGTLSLDMAPLVPEGTKIITVNGTHDVAQYAAVEVQTTAGTKVITENGTHDVEHFQAVDVAVDPPSGVATITENGVHDVSKFAEAHVQTTAGTLTITEIGTHDVERYQAVEVRNPDTANGTVVNKSSHTIYAAFRSRNRADKETGVTVHEKVAIAPGGSLSINDILRYTYMAVYRETTKDGLILPHASYGLAVGETLGVIVHGTTVDRPLYFEATGADFSLEIINA